MPARTKPLSERILEHMRRLPRGTPVMTRTLLHLGSRAAVNGALSRLARRAEVFRIDRGAYVLPVESRYGKYPPLAEETMPLLAEQRGERITGSCAMAANTLRLTTQVPVRLVFLTSGRSRHLMHGKQRVEYRHAPDWQLALGDTRAGQVIRALAWAGPKGAETASRRIGGTLTADERRQLAGVVGSLPGWLAATVERMTHRHSVA